MEANETSPFKNLPQILNIFSCPVFAERCYLFVISFSIKYLLLNYILDNPDMQFFCHYRTYF